MATLHHPGRHVNPDIARMAVEGARSHGRPDGRQPRELEVVVEVLSLRGDVGLVPKLAQGLGQRRLRWSRRVPKPRRRVCIRCSEPSGVVSTTKYQLPFALCLTLPRRPDNAPDSPLPRLMTPPALRFGTAPREGRPERRCEARESLSTSSLPLAGDSGQYRDYQSVDSTPGHAELPSSTHLAH